MGHNSNSEHGRESSHSHHYRYHSTSRSSTSRQHQSSSRHSSSSGGKIHSSRHRLEDLPKLKARRRMELFFTKNILTLFGIVFLVGAIWFGVDTWTSSNALIPKGNSSHIVQKESFISQTISTTNNLLSSTHLLPPQQPEIFEVITILFSIIVILILLIISIRLRNILVRAFSFLGWMILSSVFLIRLMTKGDYLFFYSFTLISSLVYLLYYISGFIDSYITRSTWKFRIEYSLILINAGAYLIPMIFLFEKFGFSAYEPIIVLYMLAIHLAAIIYTDRTSISFNKVPYLISGMVVASALLPTIIRIDTFLVFLAPLSVFLIFYSKSLRNRIFILVSYFIMLIMFIIYCFEWVRLYIPGIIDGQGFENHQLFFQGLVAFFCILPAFAINRNLVFIESRSGSLRWLRNTNLLKNLKGALLVVIYITSYWAFYYLLSSFMKSQRTILFDWFLFNCIYFILVLPTLYHQRSSFFRFFILVAIITSVIYPALLHFIIVELRNTLLTKGAKSLLPFYLHYFDVAALIGLLYVLMQYFKRAFPGKKALIKSFWIFLYSMMTFLILSEYDHFSVIRSFHLGESISNTISVNEQLPFSLIIIISSCLLFFIGFLMNSRFLKICSVLVFTCVLIKILSYDIWQFGTFQRTIVLFILGILVLGVSIVFQRRRRLSVKRQKLNDGE